MDCIAMPVNNRPCPAIYLKTAMEKAAVAQRAAAAFHRENIREMGVVL